MESEQKDSVFCFNSFEIVGVESGSKSVNALSTSVNTPYTTNRPMMTSVILAGKCKAQFECDTAASHSLMSVKLYKRLHEEPWCQIPKAVTENVAMKLADGTISKKSCGVIKLSVKARNTPTVELSFFVVSGPNNLLGRFAIETLWPKQYKALRNIVNSEESCSDRSGAKDSVETISVESVSARVLETQQQKQQRLRQ